MKAEKEKRGSWVVTGGAPGEAAYCTRCGQGLRLGLPAAVDVFLAASKAFVKVHSRCEPGQYFPKPPKSPEEWALGRDTGISSMTIYSAITGIEIDRKDVPHDPVDFGRCYRLLQLFPAWRKDLPKVIMLCPGWEPFVEAWDELTAMYEAAAVRMYDRMKELETAARNS